VESKNSFVTTGSSFEEISTTDPGRQQLPANSRSLDFVNHAQANAPAPLGMTQFFLVSVTVPVEMRMELARGMRMPMRMDEIGAEKQRFVVQDF
jgi:hypothetical protein